MPKTPHIGVIAASESEQIKAQQLAHSLELPWVDVSDKLAAHLFDYLLICAPTYLGIQKTGEKFTPFYIDFLAGKLRYRSEQAGLRNEFLARAIGMSPRERPTIIDTTGGLGRDSFILASLGFSLTTLERSPVLHALLNDALMRAKADDDTRPIIERIHLIQGDAIHWLQVQQGQQKTLADVIYLDPMFPERKKAASVKKEMVILQDLLGKEPDYAALFEMALSCAKKRVVVKRPRLAASLTAREPNFRYEGKSSRFDIFLTK